MAATLQRQLLLFFATAAAAAAVEAGRGGFAAEVQQARLDAGDARVSDNRKALMRAARDTPSMPHCGKCELSTGDLVRGSRSVGAGSRSGGQADRSELQQRHWRWLGVR